MTSREELAAALFTQAEWCVQLDAPLAATLLRHGAADTQEQGPTLTVLNGYQANSHTALRLLAAIHRLVLDGGLPELAHHFPSTGGDGDGIAAWHLVRTLFADNPMLVRNLIDSTAVQTNEPGRAAALLGGFLEAARRSALPLRLLEIGSSAGLNLRWDHYRYVAAGASWGPASSPAVLRGYFDRPPPLGESPPAIASRAGCDPAPIDALTDIGRQRLRSLVWPDHVARLNLLDAAIEVARAIPAGVAASGAADWLSAELADPVPGVTTVVFHSIVMQYVSADERAQISKIIDAAGTRATAGAPLARLWMEPAGNVAEIRLFWWPGGSNEVLGHAGFHGKPVTWTT